MITASFFAAYNTPSLTEVRIYDNSTYSGSDYVQSINATRLLFATVYTINHAQTDVDEMTAFKEYIVTSGTIEVNGVSYTTGDYIYLANDAEVSGGTVDETGYYGIRSTYTPSTADYVAYTPSQMLYGQTGSYFPDSVITLKYYIYTTKYSAGSVSISSETNFIVIGEPGDRITIGSETFYVGETFTRSTTFSFANGSGTNYVVAQAATTTNNFYTWYESWTIWESYNRYISTSYQVSQETLARYLAVTTRLTMVSMYTDQQFNVSLQGAQDLLDDIITNYPL